MIYSWIDIEPIRSIGWDGNSLEPESRKGHSTIHQCTIGSRKHTTSNNKRGISTIRDEYLVAISVTRCCVLRCHNICSPWRLTTTCRSLIHRSNLKLWTVIWVSSYICHSKRLSSIDSKISIIICPYCWWIDCGIDSSILITSKGCVYRYSSLLSNNHITICIDSEWRSNTTKYWSTRSESRKSKSRSIIGPRIDS